MAGKKILVADDSLTIQKVIRLALSNEGYDIQAVSDGGETLSQIAVFRPDVVLIDVSLPIKNAVEIKTAFDQIAGQYESLPRFVLMSSAFEQMDEAKIAAAKFDGKLTKPFDPAHLRKVIIDVLNLSPPPIPVEHLRERQFSEPTKEFARELPEMPSPVAFSENSGSESDIKHLTESTIRMSGLDDYEWSIEEKSVSSHQETAAPPTPAPIQQNLDIDLPPIEAPSYSENSFQPYETYEERIAKETSIEGTQYRLDPPEDAKQIDPPFFPEQAEVSGPQPFEYKHKPYSQDSEDEPHDEDSPRYASSVQEFPHMGTPAYAGISINTTTPMSGFDSSVTPYRTTDELVYSQNADYTPPPPSALGSTFSPQQIELLVQKQVHEALEKMAQKMLPDIAERLIKAEIHRLLQDQN